MWSSWNSEVFICSTSRDGWPRLLPPYETTSRSRQKCGSCVASESRMRSASRPYRQCFVFALLPFSFSF